MIQDTEEFRALDDQIKQGYIDQIADVLGLTPYTDFKINESNLQVLDFNSKHSFDAFARLNSGKYEIFVPKNAKEHNIVHEIIHTTQKPFNWAIDSNGKMFRGLMEGSVELMTSNVIASTKNILYFTQYKILVYIIAQYPELGKTIIDFMIGRDLSDYKATKAQDCITAIVNNLGFDLGFDLMTLDNKFKSHFKEVTPAEYVLEKLGVWIIKIYSYRIGFAMLAGKYRLFYEVKRLNDN